MNKYFSIFLTTILAACGIETSKMQSYVFSTQFQMALDSKMDEQIQTLCKSDNRKYHDISIFTVLDGPLAGSTSVLFNGAEGGMVLTQTSISEIDGAVEVFSQFGTKKETILRFDLHSGVGIAHFIDDNSKISCVNLKPIAPTTVKVGPSVLYVGGIQCFGPLNEPHSFFAKFGSSGSDPYPALLTGQNGIVNKVTLSPMDFSLNGVVRSTMTRTRQGLKGVYTIDGVDFNVQCLEPR